MTSKELREGNYLQREGHWLKIEVEHIEHIRDGNVHNFQSIALTKHDNLTGLEFLDQSADFKVFDTGSVVLTHLKYLHQLQNLYFVLTNEELETNL